MVPGYEVGVQSVVFGDRLNNNLTCLGGGSYVVRIVMTPGYVLRRWVVAGRATLLRTLKR